MKFSDFQKTVNVTPIKMYRTFNKLRDAKTLQQEIDWKMEGGSLYVTPSRLYVEARKLRPEIEYVSVKSSEIKTKSEGGEVVSQKSDEEISMDKEVNSNEFIRNHLKTNENKNEVVTLLKEQIAELKTDKKYLQGRVIVKTKEVEDINKERAFLMQNWQKFVEENDDLRRQLTSGESEIRVKSVDVDEQGVPTEQKFEVENGQVSETVGDTPPPETPPDDHHDDFTSENMDTPSSEEEPHTEENFAGEEVPSEQENGGGGGVVNTTSA